MNSLIIISLVTGICHSFSFDTSYLTRSLPGTLLMRVHHRRPPSPSPCYSTKCCRGNGASLTLRWNSPTESSAHAATPEGEEQTRPNLHPPTLQAIAEALLVRAQNKPDVPLRFVDDGSMEPWEITLAAGNIAQRAAEEWAVQLKLNPTEDEDVLQMQIMSGRVVAVLTRLEELEGELLDRSCKMEHSDGCESLGVPEEELKAWKSAEEEDDAKRISYAAAAIDAACLFDNQLRYNRARSLLAIFLHEIEGPGLRQNNVVIPCMDVDFLSEEERGMLLLDEDITKNDSDMSINVLDSSEAETPNVSEDAAEDSTKRPSLHPIAIDAIEEAFRLRAQNTTTSPLRLIDAQTEWFQVHYSIVKFADRFLEKYKKSSTESSTSSDNDFQWTEEELQTIGGRIVGVLMRLDDLEWEWNHRIRTSSLADADSSSMIPSDVWKTTLGLHPGDVEQNCFRTVDTALSEDKDFARARAEKMLALFLMNIELPGMEASESTVPGGSYPDFIEDTVQMELMMPRPTKE